MSGTRAISTTSRRELSSSLFFLQGKAPKEIHAILTETLACFLPGRAKDLSAPLYCPYCHSVIRYRTIPWGNCSDSGKTYIVQKKIVRIVTGAQLRASCTSLLIQLEILPAPWQCIPPLMSCIISNQEISQINLYTILKQGISTNFIHQCQPVLFSTRYIPCCKNNYQHFTTQCDDPQE